MLHAVIMAGGSGTRFWPVSRRNLPKQFLRFASESSLIQLAAARCRPLIPAERSWVVTNARFFEQTRTELPDVPVPQILQEPCGRNTAPCVGLAAISLLRQDPDAVMLLTPADQLIDDPAVFQGNVRHGLDLIAEDPRRLVLLGVPPTYPSTGFGYIERGDALGSGAYVVQAFREKPDRPTAEDYLRSGRYYWNCGIFLWRADRILEALTRHEPEMSSLLQQLRPHVGEPGWNTALAEVFPRMKSISIDYAVLERESPIVVVEASFGWDDVGSWGAVARMHPADDDGNVSVGPHCKVNTHNCIIQSTPDHLIGTIGVKDCIIVHTPDATLIADRRDEDAVRQLVAELEKQGYDRFL